MLAVLTATTPTLFSLPLYASPCHCADREISPTTPLYENLITCPRPLILLLLAQLFLALALALVLVLVLALVLLLSLALALVLLPRPVPAL